MEQNINSNINPPQGDSAEKALESLGKEYSIFRADWIKKWYVWLLFGLIVGGGISIFSVSDLQGRFFSSWARVQLVVTSPNGGESWGPTLSHTIEWTGGNPTQTAEIKLIPLDNPAGAIVIVRTPNTGSYKWSFSPGSISSGNYFVQVCILRLNSCTRTDSSDALFSIVPSTLQITLDKTNPPLYMTTSGKENVTVAVLQLLVYGENVDLKQIAFQMNGSQNVQSVSKVTLWDGATLVGYAYFDGVNTVAVLSSSFVIPKDAAKILTIKANIDCISGDGCGANAGDVVSVNYDGGNLQTTYGIDTVSGKTIYSSSPDDTSAQGVMVFRSFPYLTRTSVPSNTLVNGTIVLYRFQMVADKAGDVAFAKFAFDINPASSATTSNVQLYAYSDAGFSVPAYAVNPIAGGKWGGGSVDMSMVYSPPLSVPAGSTRYFELKGTVQNAQAGDVLGVTLSGDMSSNGVGSLGSVSSYKENDFIWTGNSYGVSSYDTADWANGYIVPGLPGEGMAYQTFTK